ncbi:MAG: Rieske (2Fe-2S) protein [Gemmatimonadota bacterium]
MSGVIDRRAFVVRCTGVGAALVLGGCVAMVTYPVPMLQGRVRLSIADYPDLAAPNGAIKILPMQHDQPLYVLAQDGGEFVAVSPICTHRGCTVDVHGARLVCPCHGSTYSRTGEVLRGPAQRRLTSYRVSRQGDALIIDLTTARS